MAIKFLDFVHKIKAIIKKHGSRFVYRSRKSNEIDALLFYCLHCHKDVSMDTTSADLNDLNSRYLKR